MKKILITTLLFAFGSALTAFAADGKTVWEEQCAKCHGPDGKGETKMGKKLSIKDFTDAKVQAAFTDDEAFKAVKEGLKNAEGVSRMKAVEGLTDDEIKAVVAQVRSFKK
ncbi:MAG TPA: cytochrome c [Opitutaceae bacterium]|nr:cytochrome c [Opitutaceae bacterium]